MGCSNYNVDFRLKYSDSNFESCVWISAIRSSVLIAQSGSVFLRLVLRKGDAIIGLLGVETPALSSQLLTVSGLIDHFATAAD